MSALKHTLKHSLTNVSLTNIYNVRPSTITGIPTCSHLSSVATALAVWVPVCLVIWPGENGVGDMVLVCTIHPYESNSHHLYRPIYGHQLVQPSCLHGYHDCHQLLGPSCLCPLFGPLEADLVFKEAAIYMPVFGPYAGNHIFECWESQCGYLGKPFLSKRISLNVYLVLSSSIPTAKVFPLRGQ